MSVNRWSVGEIPEQPEAGTTVADRDGVVWTRIGPSWQRAGLISFGGGTPWSKLLLDHGPLTRLVPAGERDVDPPLRPHDPKFRAMWIARKQVESAARRCLDAVDSGVIFDDVDGPIVNLRGALAEVDRVNSDRKAER